MKILFLISSAGGGKATGGHYHSLHQVSLEMAKTCDVKIIMLGETLSPVLADNPYLSEHIAAGHSVKGIIRLNKRLKQLFKAFLPDVIHCFDTNSLNRCLLCTTTWNIPVILNKCGGANPSKGNYQHANATVVFSHENQQWYLNNKHYDNGSIFLIPNRVMALKLLPESLREEKADPNKITFVRVSRLGGAYEMTLLQTFNLIEELHKKYPVELFVIGRITDEGRFNKIIEQGEQRKLPIHYIIDERAAKGANFLYLADFVIGTGRSFMEATSLGIPTLAPAKNTTIPILISKSNVERYLATNFSERAMAQEEDEAETIETIQTLVNDRTAYHAYQRETKLFFDEFFGAERINSKYTAAYEYVLSKPISRVRLLLNNYRYILRFILKGN